MTEPMVSSELFNLVVFTFVVVCTVFALAGLIYDAIFSKDPKPDICAASKPRVYCDDPYLPADDAAKLNVITRSAK